MERDPVSGAIETRHPRWKAHKHEIMEAMPHLPRAFIDPYIDQFIREHPAYAKTIVYCEACHRSMVALKRLRHSLFAPPPDEPINPL